MNNPNYNVKSAKSNTATASNIIHAIVAKLGTNPKVWNEIEPLIEALPDESIKAEAYRLIQNYNPDLDINSLLAGDLTGDNEPQRERFTLRGSDYYLQDREPIPHIVDKVVYEKSVNLVYGGAGVGKTWSMQDLGVCVASDKPWLEFAVNKCNVLIIDEESGERRLADRMKAVLKGELVEGDIPLWSVSLAGFDLRYKPDGLPEDLKELIRLIRETEAKLVIIDALADIMLGGDENAVKDTQAVFWHLRLAAEMTGAAFIVIHHSNKQDGYRGSTAIKGAIDYMFSVKSEPGSDLITFKSEKVRDGEPMKFAAKAVWEDGGFFMQPADYQDGNAFLTKAQQFTLDYFTDKGNSTLDSLIDHAGGLYADVTLKTSIQKLIKDGLLIRVNEGGKRVKAVYGVRKGDCDND